MQRQRGESKGLYQLETDLIQVEPWTSKPTLLAAMNFLFQATEQLVLDNQADTSTDTAARADRTTLTALRTVHEDLKRALADLADFLLEAYEERIIFLNE